MSFWEVPRDALNAVLASADKTNDGAEGKILIWLQSSKIAPVVETNGQQIEGGRTVSLTNSPLVISDGSENNSLQFSLNLSLKKAAAPSTDFNIKTSIEWHLPNAQTAGNFVDASISGTATLPPKGAILIILDPAERSLRADLIKGVAGPMSIFASEEFKAGVTDWVVLVRQK